MKERTFITPSFIFLLSVPLLLMFLPASGGYASWMKSGVGDRFTFSILCGLTSLCGVLLFVWAAPKTVTDDHSILPVSQVTDESPFMSLGPKEDNLFGFPKAQSSHFENNEHYPVNYQSKDELC